MSAKSRPKQPTLLEALSKGWASLTTEGRMRAGLPPSDGAVQIGLRATTSGDLVLEVTADGTTLTAKFSPTEAHELGNAFHGAADAIDEANRPQVII